MIYDNGVGLVGKKGRLSKYSLIYYCVYRRQYHASHRRGLPRVTFALLCFCIRQLGKLNGNVDKLISSKLLLACLTVP